MGKGGSLAAQLALLNDVAPTDSPADDVLLGFPSASAASQRTAAADHDLNSGEDEDGEEGFESEDSDGHDDDGDAREEDDDDLGEDHDDDEDDFDEDEDDDDDDDDEELGSDDGTEDESATPAAGTLASQAAESAALIDSLKAEAAANAQRGRAIKRQQRDWNSILELRIRAQKVVRGAMRIDPASVDALTQSAASPDETAQKHATLLRQLDALSASLFVLRTTLLEQSHPEDVSLPANLSINHFTEQQERATKRLKLDVDADADAEAADVHGSAISDLLALESRVLQPLAAAVLTAAHHKVNAATVSGATGKAASATKFSKTSATSQQQQSPAEQIDAALANAESRRRLVERTQVWRGDETLLRARAAQEGADAEVDDGAGAPQASAREEDIFDDSDLYAHLLCELIESKGGRSTAAPTTAADAGTAAAEGRGGFNADLTLLAPALLNGGRKAKRAVDTRASKGRKIRYEVNEKIANFMPPVPRLLWDEDQIDRLFAKLNTRLGDRDVVKRTAAAAAGDLGPGVGEDEDEEEAEGGAGAEEDDGSANVIDGLQLFG